MNCSRLVFDLSSLFGYHNRYRPPYPYGGNPYGGYGGAGAYPGGGYGGAGAYPGGGYGTNFLGAGAGGYGGYGGKF